MSTKCPHTDLQTAITFRMIFVPGAVSKLHMTKMNKVELENACTQTSVAANNDIRLLYRKSVHRKVLSATFCWSFHCLKSLQRTGGNLAAQQLIDCKQAIAINCT